ncbi:MAG: sulfotransferase domain-containing protein [Desulfobacterales bacterium]|nr:sulfotransferase domain-containing protein [Desulfobacterales bacterium]
MHFYVISHERSGTHFLINTLNENLPIRAGMGTGDGSGTGWNNIGEWFGPYDNFTGSRNHIDEYNERNWHKGAHRNTIIKTHSDAELFAIRFRKAPVVYIYRDPRDVMVSWFHYLNNRQFYINNPQVEDMRCDCFSTFIRRPVNGFLRYSYSESGNFKNVVERWAAHVSGWLNYPGTCIVKYEDLFYEPQMVVKQVAAGLNLTPNKHVNPIPIDKSVSILPRKGVVGDGTAVCSESDTDFIRKISGQYGLDWSILTGHGPGDQ